MDPQTDCTDTDCTGTDCTGTDCTDTDCTDTDCTDTDCTDADCTYTDCTGSDCTDTDCTDMVCTDTNHVAGVSGMRREKTIYIEFQKIISPRRENIQENTEKCGATPPGCHEQGPSSIKVLQGIRNF